MFKIRLFQSCAGKDVIIMRFAQRLSLLSRRSCRSLPRTSLRSVATHSYNHHATALSVLPSNVDSAFTEFKENAKHIGDVLGRMQELHRKIEAGGPQKAKEKHVARGKMLTRE